MHQKAAGSTPSQSTYLGKGFDVRVHIRGSLMMLISRINVCLSFSLFLSCPRARIKKKSLGICPCSLTNGTKLESLVANNKKYSDLCKQEGCLLEGCGETHRIEWRLENYIAPKGLNSWHGPPVLCAPLRNH